ncbi:MAG: hypothetical protein ACXVP5_08530 [Tumebacillaceae bacterium]
MNWDFYEEAFTHRDLSGELHNTPWWQSLMGDTRFHQALQQNYHMRLLLGDSAYLKKLLLSETARVSFIEQVFHPAPEHLVNPDLT